MALKVGGAAEQRAAMIRDAYGRRRQKGAAGRIVRRVRISYRDGWIVGAASAGVIGRPVRRGERWKL